MPKPPYSNHNMGKGIATIKELQNYCTTTNYSTTLADNRTTADVRYTSLCYCNINSISYDNLSISSNNYFSFKQQMPNISKFICISLPLFALDSQNNYLSLRHPFQINNRVLQAKKQNPLTTSNTSYKNFLLYFS